MLSLDYQAKYDLPERLDHFVRLLGGCVDTCRRDAVPRYLIMSPRFMEELFVGALSAFNHEVLIEKAGKSGPCQYTINLEMI